MNRVQSFFLNNLRCLPLVFFLLTISCTSKMAVISGKVVRISGNQMPSPDLPAVEPKGWETTVFFFSPLKAKDLPSLGKEGWFRRDGRTPVAEVPTDKNGVFVTRLRPGRYSVLIARDSLSLFTNVTDASGFLNPIEVEKGARRKLRLEASWDALY